MYTAGYNRPGYLPEMDVEEFDDFDDAQEWLADEVDLNLSNNTDLPDSIINAELAKIRSYDEPFSHYVSGDGYAYWIAED